MPALASQQRKILEDACTKGRRASEQAVRAALTSLAITADRPPPHLNEDDRQLRRGLRAKARQLGDEGDDLDLLVAECAYEQWHRLLFARFLAENNLLIHPEYHAPVTLEDCDELAGSLGEPDGWSVAARFAAEILPGIFRLDDPCVRLRLAPEGRLALEAILGSLPAEVFAADDALGWVYQFWQKDKKDEVNASERKIGGADLGPVTQLFTENYMVRFLLENSLGAWWAARHPDSPIVKTFEYLRFNKEGEPAAGTFDGWPDRAAEVTVMDPCCGSGHFLVEAFSMLWKMRAEEEGLTPVEVQDAVLRDNLFGLELDPRCVQIAMFNLAIEAWKAGRAWRQLPVPNIACSGISVKAPVEDWKELAGDDRRLRSAFMRLHSLFSRADTLGSLIDPKRAAEVTDPTGLQASFEDVEWSEVVPLLARATQKERADPALQVVGLDAVASARAATYLSREFSLVVTNVPYLTAQRQTDSLREYTGRYFPLATADLAAAMIIRCRDLASSGGTIALVTLDSILYLGAFKRLRLDLLRSLRWIAVVPLGPRAFSAISGEVVKPALLVASRDMDAAGQILVIDLEAAASIEAKEEELRTAEYVVQAQSSVLVNPDARFMRRTLQFDQYALLGDLVELRQGLTTGDLSRFVLSFWELRGFIDGWVPFQVPGNGPAWDGRTSVLRWEGGSGKLQSFSIERGQMTSWRGRAVWGRSGVLVGQMTLVPSLYSGDRYPDTAVVMVPRDEALLPAIWAYLRSDDYAKDVRAIDSSLKVPASTTAKVPFDIERWRMVAEDAGPLPQPWSDDPTQWLFAGRPEVSTASLQVAVGRLVGYRWPEQAESDDLDTFADGDGIVCLPPVAGEPPGADRVQQLLAAAFGESWTATRVKELLEQAGSKKKNLVDWLGDDFFKQHCALFGHRPFVWHVWDGQRDGFGALVNYHRLDRKTLEKLTYSYLGDWIERQRAEVRDDKAGAEARLTAASKLRSSLELILDGEPPYDIYVRWKSLAEQPIGWDPDVNDGVRVNVRPFVEAGVLRSSFNVHWRKDRGKNPDGSERVNHLHFTTAEKRAARGDSG